MAFRKATQGTACACIVVLVTATGFAQDSRVAVGTPVVTVGQVLSPDQFHLVSRPGRYGLGPARPGNNYAVVQGRLVRIDEQTKEVKAIIRSVAKILD